MVKMAKVLWKLPLPFSIKLIYLIWERVKNETEKKCLDIQLLTTLFHHQRSNLVSIIQWSCSGLISISLPSHNTVYFMK